MTDTTEVQEAPETEAKTVIRPNTETYVEGRSASGAKTQHSGDDVAKILNGATVEEAANLAGLVLDEKPADLLAKYAHLNVGQQRMNLGNRIRGAVNRLNKEEAGKGTKALVEYARPVVEAVKARVADAEKAAKAAAAEKEAKAKEKAEKPAKAEKSAKAK